MLQKLIKFSIENKLAIGILTVALIIWGGWSLSQLPFDSTPDITNNQVQVITQAPSLGAQEMEQFITTPVEMDGAVSKVVFAFYRSWNFFSSKLIRSSKAPKGKDTP